MTVRYFKPIGLLIFFLLILLIIRIIGCSTVQNTETSTGSSSTTVTTTSTSTSGQTTTTLYTGGRDYYPNADGSSWSYERRFSSRSEIQTEKITYDGYSKVTGIDVQIAVRETVLQGVITTSEALFRVDNTAVYRTDTVANQTVLAPLFGFPLYVGSRSGVAEVKALETVTVPAGTFPLCFKIHYSDGDLTYNIWLAQNVGLVKVEKINQTEISTAELTSNIF